MNVQAIERRLAALAIIEQQMLLLRESIPVGGMSIVTDELERKFADALVGAGMRVVLMQERCREQLRICAG